jgi:dynein heavy chain
MACLQAVYDAADPVSSPLPSPWSTRLDPFQRLLLLRVLRPDMLTRAIYGFVKASMGPKFVESPPLDLEACHADSTATSPLVFVLSPGSDPMSMLLKFAEHLKVQVGCLGEVGTGGCGVCLASLTECTLAATNIQGLHTRAQCQRLRTNTPNCMCITRVAQSSPLHLPHAPAG